MFIRGKKTPHF